MILHLVTLRGNVPHNKVSYSSQSSWCFSFQPVFSPEHSQWLPVCESLCARTHECVSGCQSLWHERRPSHRQHRIKRDNVTDRDVPFPVTAPNTGGFCSSATSSALHSLHLPRLPHTHTRPFTPAHLRRFLVCLSVCQPAPGPRRPGQCFIKRKQAGGITRGHRAMRTVNLLATSLRLWGSFDWK